MRKLRSKNTLTRQHDNVYPDESSSAFKLSSIDSTSYYLLNNNIKDQKEESSLSKHIGAQRRVVRRKLRTPRQKLEFQKICSSYTPPKKPGKQYIPTKQISDVINFWNNLGLRPCNEGTQVYNTAIKMIKQARRGKIPLRDNYKFSYDEIKEAIKKFSLSVQDPHYYPPTSHPLNATLKKVSLADFIYTSWTSKSWMIKYLEEPLKKAETTFDMDDEYPEVTDIFIGLYIKHVLGGISPKGGFNYYDKSCFIKAASRTVEFFLEYKRRMNLHIVGAMNASKFARIVWQALDKSVQGEVHKLTPGWLCSDATFQKKLPTYLYREGIIEDRRI